MRLRRPARTTRKEAQRPHAAQDVGVGPLARARLGGGERVELEAAQQIVRQDAELLPGAVGAVVVGGHDIEGELALELGERLSLWVGMRYRIVRAEGAR